MLRACTANSNWGWFKKDFSKTCKQIHVSRWRRWYTTRVQLRVTPLTANVDLWKPIVTWYVKTSFDTRTLIGPEAFYVIPLRLATNLSTLPTSDFKDSTGEFSKYRKTLTYKVCDIRQMWANIFRFTFWRGVVWTGHNISHRYTKVGVTLLFQFKQLFC